MNARPARHDRRSGSMACSDCSMPCRLNRNLGEFCTHPARAFTATETGRMWMKTRFQIPRPKGGFVCLAAEQLLQNFAMQSSACVSILRLAGIYGPHRLLRRAADLQTNLPITSPPDEWLNLIHVEDAVAAIDCISKLESPPQLTNVVAGESVTRREYYAMLARLADAPPPTFTASVSTDHPRRGGNRRVVSFIRQSLPVVFKYDSISDGLRAAFSSK